MKYDLKNEGAFRLYKENILITFNHVTSVVEFPFKIISGSGDFIKILFTIKKENKILFEKNIELNKKLLQAEEILVENKNLKKMLNFKEIINEKYDIIFAKTLMKKDGTLLVNVGSEDGVIENDLVLGLNKGVVGQIKNVDKKNSTVMLLNATHTRMPTKTKTTEEKMILSYYDENLLKVEFFKSKEPVIIEGDIVFTSNDGDVFPAGFIIGNIVLIKNVPYIKIYEELNKIDYVTIINKK
ncbi:MAG: rod shape-determining protein MreC [Rickettsiales bacterium]|nr:rod shape-determining protein MreC [Rickettsiales bacterium]